MLGDAVYAAFQGVATVKATDIDVNDNWIEYADVRDYNALRKSASDFKPDLIINLAALTDMEYCERNETNAWLTNALGAENVGLIANELDIPCVYVSTAGIFGGEKDEYNDFETPRPESIYAKSKFAGEMFVREHVRRYYVLRAGWMMGGGPAKDKKFINKLYRQVMEGATNLNVVDDKMGTPTYTHDFAAGMLKLVDSGLYGVYNQVCDGACSRYDVAEEFIRMLGFEGKIQITKVTSEFFHEEYFAPRPRSEMLVNLKLTARNLNVMRDWRTTLAEYSEVFLADIEKGNF